MGSEPRAGAGLSRSEGLLWLLLLALTGWGLSNLVLLRSEPLRLVAVSEATDGRVECYGRSSIELVLVSRLDTEFVPGRMVLNVPVLDAPGNEREEARVPVVVPSGARTILVDAEGIVDVLSRPLPHPLLDALLRLEGASLAERIERSEPARSALRSLPALEALFERP